MKRNDNVPQANMASSSKTPLPPSLSQSSNQLEKQSATGPPGFMEDPSNHNLSANQSMNTFGPPFFTPLYANPGYVNRPFMPEPVIMGTTQTWTIIPPSWFHPASYPPTDWHTSRMPSSERTTNEHVLKPVSAFTTNKTPTDTLVDATVSKLVITPAATAAAVKDCAPRVKPSTPRERSRNRPKTQTDDMPMKAVQRTPSPTVLHNPTVHTTETSANMNDLLPPSAFCTLCTKPAVMKAKAPNKDEASQTNDELSITTLTSHANTASISGTSLHDGSPIVSKKSCCHPRCTCICTTRLTIVSKPKPTTAPAAQAKNVPNRSTGSSTIARSTWFRRHPMRAIDRSDPPAKPRCDFCRNKVKSKDWEPVFNSRTGKYRWQRKVNM